MNISAISKPTTLSKLWLLGLCFALFQLPIFASHSVGADLTYACNGNDNYTITMNFYRDCDGVRAPATALINLSSASCGWSQTLTLFKQSFSAVPAICPSQANQTTCNGGTLPGVEQHIYSGNITLPQCPDIVMSYDLCCRNGAITNLSNPGSQDMYVEAVLNNTLPTCDNSPVFTTLPVPYVCAGQTIFYNHGAIDFDGDQLVYTMINPLDGPGLGIGYTGGFGVNNPMSTTGGFNFSSTTGQMTFDANPNQNAVITVLVEEYRNGVLIGSTMRDIQVVVLACNNLPPSVTGINGTSDFSIDVCVGTPLCFDLFTSDADATDNVTIGWNSAIAGATFTDNGGNRPTGTFCWTPGLADVGANLFTVTVQDDACPIFASQVQAYTVNVIGSSFNTTTATTDATCPQGTDGSMQVNITGAIPPVTYSWSTGDVTPSVPTISAGTYNVTTTNGDDCALIDTVVVSAPPDFQINFVATDAVCNGDANGTVTAFPSGGTVAADYTYLWSLPPSAGNNTNFIDSLGSGSYTLTITDDVGCTYDSASFVFQPGPIVLQVSATSTSNYNGEDISCYGESDGEVTVTSNGGSLPYTYLWSSNAAGQTTPVIANLAEGTYAVTVTDGNSCNVGTQVTLVQPDSISLALDTLANVSCFGSNDGQAEALAVGGTGAYTYSWDAGATGQNTATASNLPAGTYSVTVSDANGCTTNGNVAVTITQPNALTVRVTPTTDYAGFNITCNGTDDGAVLADVTGGVEPYTYAWNVPGSTAFLTEVFAGTYTVTVTDSNGCIAIHDSILTEPPALTLSAAITSNYSGSDISCYGEADGEATATPVGGVTPYLYDWNDPTNQSTAIAVGLSPDITYVVIVTDENECTAIDSVTLTEPDSVMALASVFSDFNGEDISCFNGTDGEATVATIGGTGAYTYTWGASAGSQNTQVATSLSIGVYQVTVSDANGCIDTSFTTLTQPDSITITTQLVNLFNGSPVSCFGANDGEASAIATGGVPNYNYTWQNNTSGTSDSVATGLAAGIYTIVLTDLNGCTNVGSITLTEPDSVMVQAIVNTDFNGFNISCEGGSNGEVEALASGGTGAYTYAWNTADLTAIVTGLDTGSYTITVTDANGCTAVDDTLLTQPTALDLSIAITSNYNGEDVSCFGATDGELTANPNGGVSPYQYAWNVGGQTTAIATNLAANTTYEVTVTDDNGCVIVADTMLTEPAELIASTVVSSDYNGVDITCFDAADGEATASAIGGTGAYGYTWDANAGGQTTAVANSLAEGNYTVTITDDNGCTSTSVVTITEPTEIGVNTSVISDFNGEDVSCFGANDGEASAAGNGGVPDYFYLWETSILGASDSIARGLSAGTYSITITDLNGCTTLGSVTLTEPDSIDLITASVDPLCFGDNSGKAAVSASGGTGIYVYSWDNTQTTSTAVGLGSGTYDITVTDANGCTNTANAIVVEPDELLLDLDVTDPSCELIGDGSLQALAKGGAPGYEYLWSTGDLSASIIDLIIGGYAITVTDANGCSVIDSSTLISAPLAEISISTDKDTVLYGGAAQLTATVINDPNGLATDNFEWEENTWLNCTFCTNPLASGLLSDTIFTVTYYDAGGCPVVDSISIVVLENEKVLFTPNIFTPNNDQVNDHFKPIALGARISYVGIFTRWGAKVFETDNLVNGWDGTFNGKEMNPGVYAYKVTLVFQDGKKELRAGSVTLIR